MLELLPPLPDRFGAVAAFMAAAAPLELSALLAPGSAVPPGGGENGGGPAASGATSEQASAAPLSQSSALRRHEARRALERRPKTKQFMGSVMEPGTQYRSHQRRLHLGRKASAGRNDAQARQRAHCQRNRRAETTKLTTHQTPSTTYCCRSSQSELPSLKTPRNASFKAVSGKSRAGVCNHSGKRS